MTLRYKILIFIAVPTGLALVLACGYLALFQGVTVDRLVICKGELADLRSQLKYYREEQRTYPSTQQGLGALVTMPRDLPSPKNWHQRLRVFPADPWKRQYKYVFPGRQNAKWFDLYSLGPDGIE